MADLPPAWKSFLDRACDYLAEDNLEEAKWSAERSLHYLEAANDSDPNTVETVRLFLDQISSFKGDEPEPVKKSLWQHLRED